MAATDPSGWGPPAGSAYNKHSTLCLSCHYSAALPRPLASRAALIAASDAAWKVRGVFILFALYQQAENAYLTPKIMQAQVQLSPAVVVIALLIGGELAGIPGTLVAVPTAVLVVEIANEYLAHKPQPVGTPEAS